MADRRSLRPWIPVAAIVALALAASLAGAGNGFTYDDRPLILENARVHSLAGWWRLFGEGYWPPPRSADVYRPLTILLFAVQWAVGSGSPMFFHAVSIVLYAAVCVAVLALARAALPRAPLAAWSAAALFAVHPVHVEAVGNVVGQAELVVALLCVVAVVRYVHARERGAPAWPTTLALAALYAGACLAKETGFVLPALLGAAELCLVRRAAPWRARLREVVPLALALGVVGAAFLAARTAVLGGLAGGISPVFVGASTADRLGTAAGAVPEWIRLLLWPARLSADYSPQHVVVRGLLDAGSVQGLALLAAGALATAVAIRRRPPVAFGLLWTGIAIAPVSNFLVPTGVLVAERTLFLPSVGAAVAVAAAVRWLAAWRPMRKGLAASPRGAALALAGALGVLLAAGVARSAARQRVWRDNATLVAQTVLDAPLSYRAHWAWGERLFDLGRSAEGEREFRTAIALFDRDGALYAELGRVYRRRGRCDAALPVLGRAVRLAPRDVRAQGDLAACLLTLGRPSDARRRALAALSIREEPEYFRRIVALSDSILAARDSAP